MKGRIAPAVAVAVIVGLLAPLAADPATPRALAAPASSVEDAAPTPTPTPTPTPAPATPTPSPTPTSEPAPSPTPTAPAAPPASRQAAREEAETDAGVVAPLAVASTAAIPPQGRLSGANRFDVSVSASRAAFPHGAQTVLIASGFAPSDGVTAAWIAGRVGAPLLYVQQSGITAAVVSEIRRLAPAAVLVYGGVGSVSDGVLNQLRTLAPDVRRIGGVDRFEASRAAMQSAGTFDTVYVTEGADLIDAPITAVAAAANARGFLLVPKSRPAADAPTIAALRAVGARTVVVVGGTGAIPSSYESSLRSAGFTVERRVAKDRYLASVMMAKDRQQTVQRAVVANPASPADSVIAAALAAASAQPLLYTIQLCVIDGVADFVRSKNVGIAAVGGDVWLGAAVLRNSSCTAERERSRSTLNAAIRATLSNYSGTYSVTVRQEGGLNAVTSVNGGTLREPASMIKIFAAWAALSRIQAGRASFGTVLAGGVDLRMCIHVMIHASDNYCHTDIVHWIGIAEINRMIRAAGFSNTHYGSVPVGTSVLYAGNRTTTNDLVEMLDGLDAGRLLSRSYADYLIREMRSQIGRARIASGIPPGVAQASKPGALWVASGLLQGDTAIVYGPKTKYFLSIVGDNGPPQAAFRAVSRTVYEHFHGAFGAAASYPAQQLVVVRDTALRASPGGRMVTVAPAGTFVENFETNRIWYEVQYGSRKLWTIVTDLRNR